MGKLGCGFHGNEGDNGDGEFGSKNVEGQWLV